jgi:uncharacterized membrane protein
MVAPRWAGSASPWATIWPSASQIDDEKSRLFFTNVVRDVRITDTIMLSATVTSAFLISSRLMGLICIAAPRPAG